jgi:hypothetical protein
MTMMREISQVIDPRNFDFRQLYSPITSFVSWLIFGGYSSHLSHDAFQLSRELS